MVRVAIGEMGGVVGVVHAYTLKYACKYSSYTGILGDI